MKSLWWKVSAQQQFLGGMCDKNTIARQEYALFQRHDTYRMGQLHAGCYTKKQLYLCLNRAWYFTFVCYVIFSTAKPCKKSIS